MATTSMTCSIFADGAHWDDMPHTAAKASCRSVVASMLFGARFRFCRRLLQVPQLRHFFPDLCQNAVLNAPDSLYIALYPHVEALIWFSREHLFPNAKP